MQDLDEIVIIVKEFLKPTTYLYFETAEFQKLTIYKTLGKQMFS